MQQLETFIKKGLITEEQLNEAIEIQKKTPQKNILTILIELDYINTEKFNKLMGVKLNENESETRIRELLLREKLITEEQLNEATEIQKKSPGKKIISILVELNYLKGTDFIKMLHDKLDSD